MDDPGMGYNSRSEIPNALDIHHSCSGSKLFLWKSEGDSIATLSDLDLNGAGRREYLFVKAQQLESKVKHLIKQIDAEMEREMEKLRKSKDEAYSRIRRDLAVAELNQAEKFDGLPSPSSPATRAERTPELPTMNSAEKLPGNDLNLQECDDLLSPANTRVAVNNYNGQDSYLKVTHSADNLPPMKRDPWTTQNDLIHSAGDYYCLQIDLKGYPQENLVVEVNEGNILTLEATLEEATPDGGKLMRLMQRAYTLPMNVDREGLEYELDEYGVLKIKILKVSAIPVESPSEIRSGESVGTSSASRFSSSPKSNVDGKETKSFSSPADHIKKRNARVNSTSITPLTGSQMTPRCASRNENMVSSADDSSISFTQIVSSNLGLADQNLPTNYSPVQSKHLCDELNEGNLIDLSAQQMDEVCIHDVKRVKRVPSEVVLSDDPVSETLNTHGNCVSQKHCSPMASSEFIGSFDRGNPAYMLPSLTPMDGSPKASKKHVAFDSEDLSSDLKDSFNLDPGYGAEALEKLVRTKMKPPTSVRLSLLTPIVKREIRIKPKPLRGSSAHTLLPVFGNNHFYVPHFMERKETTSRIECAALCSALDSCDVINFIPQQLKNISACQLVQLTNETTWHASLGSQVWITEIKREEVKLVFNADEKKMFGFFLGSNHEMPGENAAARCAAFGATIASLPSMERFIFYDSVLSGVVSPVFLGMNYSRFAEAFVDFRDSICFEEPPTHSGAIQAEPLTLPVRSGTAVNITCPPGEHFNVPHLLWYTETCLSSGYWNHPSIPAPYCSGCFEAIPGVLARSAFDICYNRSKRIFSYTPEREKIFKELIFNSTNNATQAEIFTGYDDILSDGIFTDISKNPMTYSCFGSTGPLNGGTTANFLLMTLQKGNSTPSECYTGSNALVWV
ncbi:unnamed protein product, partial [Notodromas monacha]